MFEKRIDDKNKANQVKRSKIALVAGVLAVGLLAVVFEANQLSGTAMAQTMPYNKTAGSNGTAAKPDYYPIKYGQGATVSTSGTATTKVQPDKFSVTVGVQTNGTTAGDAAASNAKLMSMVVTALRGLGIKDDQMTTNNFNVYPVYGYAQQDKVCVQTYPLPSYCQPGQSITGYRASNSIVVTLDTGGSIDAGKVIDTSVGAGANDVQGVSFFISPSQQESIKDTLTEQAISNARHRADIAAESLGMAVSGVQSINLNDVYFPMYTRDMNFGALSETSANVAATPIQPGQQDITTTVSIVFYLSEPGTTSPVPGMAATRDNSNCTNPPGGPMIC